MQMWPGALSPGADVAGRACSRWSRPALGSLRALACACPPAAPKSQVVKRSPLEHRRSVRRLSVRCACTRSVASEVISSTAATIGSKSTSSGRTSAVWTRHQCAHHHPPARRASDLDAHLRLGAGRRGGDSWRRESNESTERTKSDSPGCARHSPHFLRKSAEAASYSVDVGSRPRIESRVCPLIAVSSSLWHSAIIRAMTSPCAVLA